MKKIIISTILILTGFWCTYAQEAVPQDGQITVVQEEETMTHNPEGRQMVNEVEIPSAVQEGFINSAYNEMTIVEVYELTGEALDEIPTMVQEPKPDKLYEVVVEDSSRSAILYFTEDGRLYDSIERV